jgi:hypothetical protein
MVGQPRHDPGAPPRRRVLARRPPRQRPRTPSRDRYEEQHKPNHQAANRRQTRCNQATPADTQRQQTPSWQAGSQHRCWSRIGRACVYTAEAKDGSRRHERHPRCPVRLWSVAPGVTTDNQGLSRAQIQQVMGRLGSSTDHRPVPYNDEHQILGQARPAIRSAKASTTNRGRPTIRRPALDLGGPKCNRPFGSVMTSRRRDHLRPRRVAGVPDRGPADDHGHAGDVLFVPAGAVHAVRNVGGGNAAELATNVVEKGKPILTLVE